MKKKRTGVFLFVRETEEPAYAGQDPHGRYAPSASKWWIQIVLAIVSIVVTVLVGYFL